jgi:hypothetical protein
MTAVVVPLSLRAEGFAIRKVDFFTGRQFLLPTRARFGHFPLEGGLLSAERLWLSSGRDRYLGSRLSTSPQGHRTFPSRTTAH